MKDDWALVVGINQCPKAVDNSLRGAVSDAKKFYEWVTDPRGGDVPRGRGGDVFEDSDNHVKLLIQGTNPMKPVYAEAETFFEELFARNPPIGRRLYIYLSGHGISLIGLESIRNAALLMANATPHCLHHIPGNTWAEQIRSGTWFREVVLIMDCCRDLKKNMVPSRLPFPFDSTVGDARDCHLIEAYATGWASKAHELPFPPNNEVQGVFTYSLLKVLNSGKMTGALLKASVERHMELLLQHRRRPQRPEIKGNPTDELLAEIWFNEAADPVRSHVTIRDHPPGQPLIEHYPAGTNNPTPVPLSDWSYDGTVWQGTLEPGLYQLRLPVGGSQPLNVLAGLSYPYEI